MEDWIDNSTPEQIKATREFLKSLGVKNLEDLNAPDIFNGIFGDLFNKKKGK